MAFDPSAFSGDAAATAVLELLRDGRWRKARDAAKGLWKKDRERYLPLLVEANTGLAREMIGKGLIKEAGTVVDYLATIAPEELVKALRVEMASPKTAGGGAGPERLGGGAVWWALALRADETLAADAEVSPADQAAIDSLVTDDFKPSDPGDERAARVAAELERVRRACAATGDGRWDEAKEALRELPARSVFRHWRMFLRGVRCVFEEDRETARRCFGGLPAGGALARAAGAFRPAANDPPPAAVVPLRLAMTGQPSKWAEPLIAAAGEWEKGRWVEAFEKLRTGMNGALPTLEPGLAGVLTDALLPWTKRMNERHWEAGDELAVRIIHSRRKATAETIVPLTRALCVADHEDLEPDELENNWCEMLRHWSGIEGPDAVRDGVALQWLGEVLSKPPGGERDGFVDDELMDLPRARRALEKSIKVDPENESAWLSLLAVLSKQKDDKEHNRVLGKAAKLFPRSKGILLLAGRRALARKTYVKALTSLRAALALDPLDREVKSSMAEALVRQVVDYRKKERDQEPLWSELEPLLEDRPGRGRAALARWIARVRRSIYDTDTAAAGRAREDAVRLAPSAAERVYLEEMLVAMAKLGSRGEWQKEWKAALAAQPGWRELQGLLELTEMAAGTKGWTWRVHDFAEELIDNFEDVLLEDLDRDPDGLLAFLDGCEALGKNFCDHAALIFRNCMRNLRDELAEQAMPRQRKADPRLRLANLMVMDLVEGYHFIQPAELAKSLDAVERDAAERGMDAAVARVRKLRSETEATGRRGGEPPFDVMDDGDDEMVDPLDIRGFADPEEMAKKLMEAVESGDDAALGEILDELQRLGISPEMLEDAAEAFEEPPGAGQARKKPAARPAKKRTGDPPDPNQLDLF